MTEGNYFNVGHRGPVYKGLCAMNPCDLYIYIFYIYYTYIRIYTYIYVLPDDGKHVPKYVGETHVIFILTTKVFLVGIKYGGR
jgi:hypothetical protein